MDCHLDETNRILCITEAVHEAVMNVRIFVDMTARPLEAHTRPSATLGVSPLDTTMRGRSAQLGTSPEALVRTLRTALSLSRAMPSQFSVAQVNAVLEEYRNRWSRKRAVAPGRSMRAKRVRIG